MHSEKEADDIVIEVEKSLKSPGLFNRIFYDGIWGVDDKLQLAINIYKCNKNCKLKVLFKFYVMYEYNPLFYQLLGKKAGYCYAIIANAFAASSMYKDSHVAFIGQKYCLAAKMCRLGGDRKAAIEFWRRAINVYKTDFNFFEMAASYEKIWIFGGAISDLVDAKHFYAAAGYYCSRISKDYKHYVRDVPKVFGISSEQKDEVDQD